jgi:hypothetical protein
MPGRCLPLLAGATPALSGIWYDDSYDRALSPPLDASNLNNATNGDMKCSIIGTEVCQHSRPQQRQIHTGIEKKQFNVFQLNSSSSNDRSVYDIHRQSRQGLQP